MESFRIRKGTVGDVERISAIYDSARRFMRQSGNASQWNDGYPAEADILADIERGCCFVGETSDGNIAMVFAFILGDDPTYRIIEQGAWLNDEPYGTIHRLGSDGRTGGVLRACVDFCSSFTDNIRVDTHRDNRPMLSGLEKLGFQRCGIIYCRDGSERIAFHRIFRGSQTGNRPKDRTTSADNHD